MFNFYSGPRPCRLVSAVAASTLGSWRRPRHAAQFLKGWLRYPLEYAAGKEVDETPLAGFGDLFPFSGPVELSLPGSALARHAWNVHLDELLFIGLAVQLTHARRVFEIGTFDGGTTKHMAECLGPEGHVFTLDLPPGDFDASQGPDQFSGSQVGEKFRGTPAADRITQLLGDSTRFDYSPYEHSMDFVFVDAAHDYEHGLPDSRSALRLVRPGGVIFWHDFAPYWGGLVHAIREATQGQPLRRLSGTSLAVLQTRE